MSFGTGNHMVKLMGYNDAQSGAECRLMLLRATSSGDPLQALANTIALHFAKMEDLSVAGIGHRQGTKLGWKLTHQ